MKEESKVETSNAETVTISRAEYERLQAESERLSAEQARLEEQLHQAELAYAKLEEQMNHLLEQIRLAKHRQFGASSEKQCGDGLEQLSFLFNEAEVYADDETKKAADEGVLVSVHKRHKKHEYTLNQIPEGARVEQVEHRLEGEALVCPECGDTMSEIGKEIVNKLKFKPAEIIVEQHIYYTYACRNCNQESIETPMKKAPREKSLISGSFATPEAVAYLMTQKFVMGSPLYRQEQELKRQGIPLSRQTMSNWILRASEEYLSPVYERLRSELLKREVLHADETELQVLHEPGKAPQSKSYMWLYRTSGDTDQPIVLYEYQPGRGGIHPERFLEGFKGYLHTDGYAGYHNLPEGITVVGCWAHARRKFDEAMKSLPRGKAKGSSAAQGLAYCSLLFQIEEGLAELPPEDRYEQRLKQAKPVLDAMLAWANTRAAAPKSALGKAFTYLREQWPYLMNYLKDGRLELSNNRAERSIKPFVIDRKNFLFANTPSGARGSAVMFSLIQTAIENKLDPYRYLTWLMHTAIDLDLARPDAVQQLLPWNAPEECKSK